MAAGDSLTIPYVIRIINSVPWQWTIVRRKKKTEEVQEMVNEAALALS
jgi:hypothetical protein